MLVVAGHTLNLVAGVGGFNSLEPVQHFEEAAVKCIDAGANMPAPHGPVTLTSSETSLGFSLCIRKMKFVPRAPSEDAGRMREVTAPRGEYGAEAGSCKHRLSVLLTEPGTVLTWGGGGMGRRGHETSALRELRVSCRNVRGGCRWQGGPLGACCTADVIRAGPSKAKQGKASWTSLRGGWAKTHRGGHRITRGAAPGVERQLKNILHSV